MKTKRVIEICIDVCILTVKKCYSNSSGAGKLALREYSAHSAAHGCLVHINVRLDHTRSNNMKNINRYIHISIFRPLKSWKSWDHQCWLVFRSVKTRPLKSCKWFMMYRIYHMGKRVLIGCVRLCEHLKVNIFLFNMGSTATKFQYA